MLKEKEKEMVNWRAFRVDCAVAKPVVDARVTVRIPRKETEIVLYNQAHHFPSTSLCLIEIGG